MSPGSNTESYPAFAHIGLRETPGKNLNQVTCPDQESNPGHLVSRPDSLTRREIRTHDQRPAREKIARSTLEWRAAERGKGQRGERVERVCARIFCLPREAEKSVEMEDSRIRTFEATSLWL
ncbi:hypothetical protein ANN_04813 [Periplaneta americana]|uniref:Uncharacterized protein n=1 Tax=Periplaneta americana TaxID=6978 RepID=A0ABQ8TB54_PERAM|nr:hypothetical protein ANN_04813 [Periplaneta americana]